MLISGRSLALECHWNCCPRYPEMRKFSYMQAKHGDRVFINIDFITMFLSGMPKLSAKKFVIACQNADTEFNLRWLERLRPYALHIYSINCVIQDPIVTTIPIGFGDWSLDIIPNIKFESDRSIEILAGFLVKTNPGVRQPCVEIMLRDPRARTDLTLTRQHYYQRLCMTKYVVCPEGQGHDTHRIYESIYFGAVPILVHGNPLTHMYERLELPIKWVDSWSSIVLDWETDKANLDSWVSKNPNWFTRPFL